ncbi:MAG: hypothetical protein E7236_04695 [Lachnospiraceae bacterium]|jgi:predicted ribosomally synthesized peptide with SipW-like signal peptide|nr:hypothetical protein [Lachnospiraceae bacterium]
MMKKRTLLISALAVALAAGMTIAPAMAYFTDHTEASGRVQVALGDQTHIDEPDVDIESDSWTKHLVISNKSESNEAVYVRAQAFAPSNLTVDYSGTGWSDGGDGYWYYEEILQPGQDAEELLVEITNIPKDMAAGSGLNVAVIYETSKVLYNADGTPQAPDWSMAADVVETEGND